MRRGADRRKGSTAVEFTLVGVPLIFLLISTFEIARGMWIYHTIAHAVKEGTRLAVVHGSDCSTSPNACPITVATIAGRMRRSAVGLDPALMTVRFTPASGPVLTCKLSDCLNDSSRWPPAGANEPGKDVQINVSYEFQSIAAMLWPGAGYTSLIGTYNMPAASRENIQF
jgi:hypothetical protein